MTPDNPVILNNLGNALFYLNRLEGAENAYKKVLFLDPSYPNSYRNLAQLYQFQGNIDEAITAYRDYLDREREDGEAHYNLGLLYLSKDMNVEATSEFEAAAMYIDPDDAQTATNLGVGYFFQGEVEKAVDLFERALDYDILYIPAHYHLGVAYLSLGRVEEAIEELEMVVETEPEYPQAAENLGVAYNTAGRPEKAIPILESLLQKETDNPSTLLNLGFSFMDYGLREKANDCFQKVVSLSEPGSSCAQKAGEVLSEIQKQALDQTDK